MKKPTEKPAAKPAAPPYAPHPGSREYREAQREDFAKRVEAEKRSRKR